PRSLVAGNERLADDERADAPVQVIVQVRTADAGRAQPQLDLVRRQRRRLLGFQAQVARAVDLAGQRHGFTLSAAGAQLAVRRSCERDRWWCMASRAPAASPAAIASTTRRCSAMAACQLAGFSK